jgi:hypothetical protein
MSVGRHDPVNAIERLVEHWRSAGVPLEPPASDSDLRSLSEALAAPLPSDLAAFYQLANGMPDLEYDAHEVSFWSIAKILAERERRNGTDPNGSFSDLAIADFLINSWFFSLRVRCRAVTVFVEGSGEEVQSLSVLAARYIEAPESLPVL